MVGIKKYKKGFTLVELMLYATIFCVVIAVMAGFLWNIILGNIKETGYQEAQQNARFVLSKISQETKKATAINTPLPGATSNILSLAMATPNLDPTIFDVDSGRLRIRYGFPEKVSYLTSDQVIIDNLQFTNLSYPGTPGTIRLEMVINRANPGNRVEYQASVNLKSTISLVHGGAAILPPHLSQLQYRWRNDNGGE